MKCCRPYWAKLLFWWRISMIHLLLGGPSPLRLKIFSKKVSMFKRRMSYTIEQTFPPWSRPRLEGHFGWPTMSILWCSRPSLKFTQNQNPLWLTCFHPQVYSLSSPKFHLMQMSPIPILSDISHIGNNIKACQILCCHIMALELDMDIFQEVLEFLVQVPM